MNRPLIDILERWASSRGWPCATGPIRLIDEVRRDIESRLQAGEIDEGFYRSQMSWFTDADENPFPGASTIIAMAVPWPEHEVVFDCERGPVTAVIPPVYVQRNTIRVALQGQLTGLFGGMYKFEPLPAPAKAIASRLGLVRYGRNNITYADRYGSYHRLVGFISDMPFTTRGRSTAREPECLPECAMCDACRIACPTGAIVPDRFLIHAERCLTFYNQTPGEWPAGIPSNVHTCVIGCLACQLCCPANASHIRRESTGVRFDAAETAAILRDEAIADSPVGRSIRGKLHALEIDEYAPLIGRNVRALLGNGSPPA